MVGTVLDGRTRASYTVCTILNIFVQVFLTRRGLDSIFGDHPVGQTSTSRVGKVVGSSCWERNDVEGLGDSSFSIASLEGAGLDKSGNWAGCGTASHRVCQASFALVDSPGVHYRVARCSFWTPSLGG